MAYVYFFCPEIILVQLHESKVILHCLIHTSVLTAISVDVKLDWHWIMLCDSESEFNDIPVFTS